MSSELHKPKDIVSGGLVIAIGAVFLFFGHGLKIGTSSRMGPGYFPMALSVLMIGLGIAIVLRALKGPDEEPLFRHIPWRAVSLVIGTIIFFGLTVKGLGLPVSLAITALGNAWASSQATWRASIPLAIGLSVFCTLVFVYALGMPLPVVGSWLTYSYWSPVGVMASPLPTP